MKVAQPRYSTSISAVDRHLHSEPLDARHFVHVIGDSWGEGKIDRPLPGCREQGKRHQVLLPIRGGPDPAGVWRSKKILADSAIFVNLSRVWSGPSPADIAQTATLAKSFGKNRRGRQR